MRPLIFVLLASATLLTGPAAAQSDDWLKTYKYERHSCKLAGLTVTKEVLLLTCEKPTADGVDQFLLQREYVHFEETRRFGESALDLGRPVSIIYHPVDSRMPRECEPSHCRTLFAVERH